MKTNKILILFGILGLIGCSDSSRFSFPDTSPDGEITPDPTTPPGDPAPAPAPDGSGNTGGTDGAGAAALCQDATHVNVYLSLSPEEKSKLDGEVLLTEKFKKLMANIAPPAPPANPKCADANYAANPENKCPNKVDIDVNLQILQNCFSALKDIQDTFKDGKGNKVPVADDFILLPFILSVSQERLLIKGLKADTVLPAAHCAPFILRTECTDQTSSEWVIPTPEELSQAGFVWPPPPAPAPPPPVPVPVVNAEKFSIQIRSYNANSNIAKMMAAIAKVLAITFNQATDIYSDQQPPYSLPDTRCYNKQDVQSLMDSGINLNTTPGCVPH